MNNFKNWYVSNQDEITWFIIGWLTFACIDSFIEGSYGWAAVSAFLIWTNYKLRSIRLQ